MRREECQKIIKMRSKMHDFENQYPTISHFQHFSTQFFTRKRSKRSSKMVENREINENPRKSYLKMQESSRFDHIKVTMRSKYGFLVRNAFNDIKVILGFLCPERFWPCSGNTLHQASEYHGF